MLACPDGHGADEVADAVHEVDAFGHEHVSVVSVHDSPDVVRIVSGREGNVLPQVSKRQPLKAA